MAKVQEVAASLLLKVKEVTANRMSNAKKVSANLIGKELSMEASVATVLQGFPLLKIYLWLSSVIFA